MKLLFLIPARGGSKGLSNKNIKILNGKPLIAYSIEAALTTLPKGIVCVSTDSEEIRDIAKKYGAEVPFLRPEKLASDTATSEDVIKHSLEFYRDIGLEFDFVVMLQPTSPLRKSKDIINALKLVDEQTELIVSVKETDSNPYYVLFEENSHGILEPTKKGTFTRRQDCPKVYELNGAIYIINVKMFLQKGYRGLKMEKYEMEKINSIDIDDIWDFKFAEFFVKAQYD